MTNIEITYCPITVDDIDAALGFYRDALGLEVVRDVANGDHHWVTLGMPDQSGVEIVLSQPGGGRSPEDAEALHRLVAKGMMPPIVFRSSDLDAMFEKVSASGAEVLQEPIKQPWGPRDCAFRDPAGNMVRINDAGQ
ncbi:VOC family protein [Gordonia hydrophobica]|uniref:VOC family protein n=1 Tax=Gordonia hydrophobica TaxID=40516 RepID=A0ABZ2U2Y9_9ACTN|nr:VOC family protein [Gordonia hydrophobica]MBM7367653.1 catechol 2,3-dioxygenase-like lactoylglutathione lyase family enzyme [Gordonia hydrophobica]